MKDATYKVTVSNLDHAVLPCSTCSSIQSLAYVLAPLIDKYYKIINNYWMRFL